MKKRTKTISPEHFVPSTRNPLPHSITKRKHPEDIPSYPELRDELKPFSDRELIYELQMRRKIRRIAAIVNPQVITWEGQVIDIECEPDYRTGSPLYRVRPLQPIWFMRVEKPFRLKSGKLKEENFPKIGDHVVLQYKINPKAPEQASFNRSLIIENKGECKYVWIDQKNGNPKQQIYKHLSNEKE